VPQFGQRPLYGDWISFNEQVAVQVLQAIIDDTCFADVSLAGQRTHFMHHSWSDVRFDLNGAVTTEQNEGKGGGVIARVQAKIGRCAADQVDGPVNIPGRILDAYDIAQFCQA